MMVIAIAYFTLHDILPVYFVKKSLLYILYYRLKHFFSFGFDNSIYNVFGNRLYTLCLSDVVVPFCDRWIYQGHLWIQCWVNNIFG